MALLQAAWYFHHGKYAVKLCGDTSKYFLIIQYVRMCIYNYDNSISVDGWTNQGGFTTLSSKNNIVVRKDFDVAICIFLAKYVET